MKAKKQNPSQTAKLTVESYEQKGDVLICQAGREGDESNTEHEVTIDELHLEVGRTFDATNPTDTQETIPVTFFDWFDNNQHTEAMHGALAAIIERKEVRAEMNTRIESRIAEIKTSINDGKQRRA